MDKFDIRTKNAGILFQKRMRVLIVVSSFFALQIILLLLSKTHENLNYCIFLLLFFDFGYGLNHLHKELFIRQLKEALDSMECSFSVGRCVVYPRPLYPSAEGSFLWESIRGRVLYRYRYHSRSFDIDFTVLDCSNPALCAWAASWFYINDDLNSLYHENFCVGSIRYATLKFALLLGKYGFEHDFISDIAWKEWHDRIYANYRDFPDAIELFSDFAAGK